MTAKGDRGEARARLGSLRGEGRSACACAWPGPTCATKPCMRALSLVAALSWGRGKGGGREGGKEGQI